MTGDARVLGPGLAPTPFTPEEIRAGCPDGRRILLRVESGDEAPAFHVNRFRDGDADGVTLEAWPVDASGDALEPPTRTRVTWHQLQAHASFPVASTTVTEVTLETDLGSCECLRYDVSRDARTDTFWFATGRPGMPIRYATLDGDGAMRVVTMIDDRVA